MATAPQEGSTVLSQLLADIAAAPAGPHIGAFFDVDGTLVDGFTATAHAGDRMRRRQARPGEVLGVLEASLRYRWGRMQFERLIVRAAGYLRGERLVDLDALGERLFVERVADRVFAPMREVVEAHRRRGHTVAVSSSALTIHAEPVARSMGIDEVLCNHFTVDVDGRLTGGVEAPVIWGPEKAAAVRRFGEARGVALAESWFYADGDEDIALMELVGRPRPVNPRPGLRSVAERHGWPVLDLPGRPRPGAGAVALGAVRFLAVGVVRPLAVGAVRTVGGAGVGRVIRALPARRG